MKFEKIKPGMILFDVHSHRRGNTTMTTMGCWEVFIESVDVEKRTAMARWNGNPARKYFERDLNSLREKKPEFEATEFGGRRLKRRSRGGAK